MPKYRESASRWLLKSIAFIASALLCTQPVSAEPGAEGLVNGKPKGRSIYFEVVIPGTPADLFQSWTDEASANRFFGVSSNIEPEPDGLYEIKFEGVLPDGRAPGTTGTRILYFKPDRALAFEWQAPVFADELNTTPLPTWVELRFIPRGAEGNSTALRLEHHGFGSGETWDRVYTFFEHNWFEVLFRLRTLYEQEPGQRAD
jgi:uncharacterized protein YndB with AHSA1/START domain